MGYLGESFERIAALPLPEGGRVLDLGSQDAYVFDDDQLRGLNRFLTKFGAKPFAEAFGQRPAGDIWRRAGFDYLCVDVDQRRDTIRLDLQRLALPPDLRGRFDLVMNLGTTEHLANPIGGLALMHHACRVGGLIFNDVPVFGWGNHGLANLTPKFWHLFAVVNGYEPIACHIRRTDEGAIPCGNLFCSGMEYIEGIKGMRDVSAMIQFAVRKRYDVAFVPPFDGTLPASDGRHEAELMMGSLAPFVASKAMTRADARAAVNAVLERYGKPYRVKHQLFRGLSTRRC